MSAGHTLGIAKIPFWTASVEHTKRIERNYISRKNMRRRKYPVA